MRVSAARGGGFTLLEVMVALAIAAPPVLLLARASADAVGAAVANRRTEAAVAQARSLLALADDAALAPGEASGEADGFAWRRRVVALASVPPVRPVRLPGPFASGATLYRVRVSVGWAGGGVAPQVALETLRLGPAAGSGPGSGAGSGP